MRQNKISSVRKSWVPVGCAASVGVGGIPFKNYGAPVWIILRQVAKVGTTGRPVLLRADKGDEFRVGIHLDGASRGLR